MREDGMDASRSGRQLGFWMTWALVVGTMIGSGIFMLPVSLAPFGRNAVIGWIVSGIGAVSLAYAMGHLARDGGQGIQAYIERAFGSFVACLTTFTFWVSVWAALAAVSLTGAAATARLFPALGGDTKIALTAVCIIAFFQFTNAFGARSTGRLAVLTTAIKILPLLAVLVVLAQVRIAGEPLSPLAPMPIGLDNIAAASALTLFAMLGFETAVAPVGKIRDPERTIPRAIVGGTAFVAILYLASSTAILLLLSVAGASGSSSPFADAIGRSWGEFGAMFAAFGIVISAIGYVNANVLVVGELGYSMALRRELPTPFARTRANATPLNAQLLGSGLAAALILANISRGTGALFTFMALLTTSATLWLYLAAALAALKRRPRGLSLLVVLIGLAFTLFAFYGSGYEANLWSLALLAAGAVLYAVMRSRAGSNPAAATVLAAPPESSA
jgi:APA family basic amino acid/polyamine antiporter